MRCDLVAYMGLDLCIKAQSQVNPKPLGKHFAWLKSSNSSATDPCTKPSHMDKQAVLAGSRSNDDHLLYICGVEDCRDIPKRRDRRKINAAHVVRYVNQSLCSFFPCGFWTLKGFAPIELLLHQVVHYLQTQHVRKSTLANLRLHIMQQLHWIQLSTHLRPSCSIEGFLQKCCLDRRDPKFETIAKALFHPNKHSFYDGNKNGKFRRMLNEC